CLAAARNSDRWSGPVDGTGGMAELLFFERPAGLTLAEIVSLTGATARAGAPLDRRITNIAPLDQAGPSGLALLDRPRIGGDLRATRAGICLLAARFVEHAPPDVGVLISTQPYRAFVEVARKLFPGALRPSSLFDAVGVAPGAHVHPAARFESDVTVDPGAVIGPGAAIGRRTRVGDGAAAGLRRRIVPGCCT